MNLEFRAWLKTRRRALDLTQDDLAQRAFCSVNTIRKIEGGALKPSRELALELARALAVPSEMWTAFVNFARAPAGTAEENAFSENALTSEPPAPQIAVPRKFQPPAPLTAAIGRERDVAVITKLVRLPSARLITLTGPPGTGKTRLSLEVVSELQAEFEHGAAFIPLAPLAHAELVERAIADGLDVHASTQSSLGIALRDFLREQHLLLALDNFEHVLDAAPLVGELLHVAPRLKILATSREPLHLYGEREIPVATLTLPPLEPLPAWYDVAGYAAVQLFVERAQAVNPAFEIEPLNAETVARLVVRLDGLPLAIEMAAARVKWETPQQLLSQLSQRLATLSNRARDLDARQQTLRGAMDWSYERLDAREQFTLRHLGVFRGGFMQDAADAVCGFPCAALLQSLIEKSLVKTEVAPNRFTLLEMIREYALEKLNAADEIADASERHYEFFTTLARQAQSPEMLGVPTSAVHRLSQEQDNLRRALDWTVESKHPEKTLALAGALAEFWYAEQVITEAIRWLELVFSLEVTTDAELMAAKARAQTMHAELTRITGDWVRARQLLEQAVADLRALGELGQRQLVFVLHGLSRLMLWQGEAAQAHAYAREALDIALATQDFYGQAGAWRRLGEWALGQSQFEYALECLDCALAVSTLEVKHFARAVALLERGDIRRAQGDLKGARADYEAALQFNAHAQNKIVEASLLESLGVLEALEGNPTGGVKLLEQAVAQSAKMGMHAMDPYLFADLALCAALQGHAAQAMAWLGKMDTWLELRHGVLVGAAQLEYAKTIELTRQQATQEQLDAWRVAGRAHATPNLT